MPRDRTARLRARPKIVVGHSGQRVALRVFRPRDLRSVHVDVCRSCPSALAIEDESVMCVPEVDCTRADSFVGAAMGETSVAIEVSVSVAGAPHLLEPGRWMSVLVLDDGHRALVMESSPLLDVVPRIVHERARGAGRRRGADRHRDRQRSGRPPVVSALMTRPGRARASLG